MAAFRQLGRGLWLGEDYLAADQCEGLLATVRAHVALQPAVRVERPRGGRGLRYEVLDGHRIASDLPAIAALQPDLLALAAGLSGIDLSPLANRAAAINLNITPPGGEYRWHYDRNAVTAILYLNAVEGGETELLPGYRLHLGRWRHTALQRWADRALGAPGLRAFAPRPLRVAPRAGRVLVMRGDRCLHSVAPVRDGERCNVIMTFDRPRVRHRVEHDLDPYLYSTARTPDFDPNYLRRRK